MGAQKAASILCSITMHRSEGEGVRGLTFNCETRTSVAPLTFTTYICKCAKAEFEERQKPLRNKLEKMTI